MEKCFKNVRTQYCAGNLVMTVYFITLFNMNGVFDVHKTFGILLKK